ncbi:MAG: response regulator [Archangiaceae bacterium]|nr:response regulator [Archangiaceae bacterium]
MRPSPRVMLVDDDELVLRQVGDALYAAGHTVQLCQFPTLAIPTAQSFKPDVLVLDLSMPVLNGYEVARSMRRFKELHRTKVVFLTGNMHPREDLRALLAGASDIWRKPFDPERHVRRLERLLDEPGLPADEDYLPSDAERLRHRVLQFLRREKVTGVMAVNPGTPFEGRATLADGEMTGARLGPLEGTPALDEMLALEDGVWRFEMPGQSWLTPIGQPAAPPDPSHYKARVLVVDDDADVRKLAALQLKRSFFEVVEAVDGDEGHRKAQNQDFDVVVADLNMPVLDGWGMLRLLKADARMREAPVLFLSAHDDYRETLRAARSGAHDYLAKTGHSDELVQHVRKLAQPRVAAHGLIRQREAIGDLELSVVGPVWLLRVLGELEGSYTVHARDEWGRYSLAVQRGRLVKASASSGPRSASGVLAMVSLIVSRGARAVLAPIDGQDAGDRPLLLDALTEALGAVTRLERKVMEEKLTSARFAAPDPELYQLFLRVASSRDVQLARALCEDQVAPSQLSAHLEFPDDEVRASLVEMLRRGVITLS